MQSIELSCYIDKPVDVVYSLVSDMESYPQYMKNIISVRVLEKSIRTAVTTWTVEVDGVRLTWQENDDFFPEERVIRFRQIQGDMSHYEGEWSVQPAPGGAVLKIRVGFDLGLSMISGLLQYLLKKKVENTCREMLSGIQEMAGQEKRF